MKYVLMFGSPNGGFNFIGPFDTAAAATSYAENNYDIRGGAWWICPLEKVTPRRKRIGMLETTLRRAWRRAFGRLSGLTVEDVRKLCTILEDALREIEEADDESTRK